MVFWNPAKNPDHGGRRTRETGKGFALPVSKR